MNRLNQLPGISFNTSSDPAQFCAIANFKVEGRDPVQITEYPMAKHKIITTPIVHDEFSGIRITPNIFTNSATSTAFAASSKNGDPRSLVITLVARGDPASAERLSSLYIAYSNAVKGLYERAFNTSSSFAD